MKSSKLALSTAEWQMAASAEIILTKNKIIDHVYEMYGALADDFREQSKCLLETYPDVFSIHPKISKGEQYEGMPWVMLDYPRHYSKIDGHFAIRCFFWWGHFFSISIQVSGVYLNTFNTSLHQLHQQGWLVGMTNDPWNQLLPNPYWHDWDEKIFSADGNEKLYAKAAKKIPVTEWPQVQYFLKTQYEELIRTLQQAY